MAIKITGNKILKILETFSFDDIESFQKYVSSPFFNTHKDTILLFEALKKHYPDFDIEWEKVWNGMFPDKNYQARRMVVLRNYLCELAYGFLSYQELEEAEKHSALMRSLNKRKLMPFIPFFIKKWHKLLAEQPYKGEDYLYSEYQLTSFAFAFPKVNNYKDVPLSIYDKSDALDNFYLLTKLQHFLSMPSNGYKPTEANKQAFQAAIFTYCKTTDMEAAPVRDIFYTLLMLLMGKEEKGVDYETIKAKILTHYALIPPFRLADVCTYIINYCNSRYQRGEEHFHTEIFNWFKFVLDNKLLFNLHTSLMALAQYYINITSVALREGEFEWVKGFIKSYKKYFTAPYQGSLYAYNMAHLLFYQEKYSQALKHLEKFELSVTYYKRAYYLLSIRLRYKNDAPIKRNLDAFRVYCNTADTYIRRDKTLTDSIRQSYLNFLHFIRRLFHIRYKAAGHLLPSLREQLVETSPLRERVWLLGEVDDLMIDKL